MKKKYRITLYWVSNDWGLIRAVRRKYRLPDMMTVNGLTYAEVDEDTLAALRKGEPKYIVFRKIEAVCGGTDGDNEEKIGKST